MSESNTFYSQTAAINWLSASGALHVRVYASDGNYVTERCSDAGTEGWTTGQFTQPGSHVSATSWSPGGVPHIRVYVTDLNGNTTEWCYDAGGPWYQGTYTPS